MQLPMKAANSPYSLPLASLDIVECGVVKLPPPWYWGKWWECFRWRFAFRLHDDRDVRFRFALSDPFFADKGSLITSRMGYRARDPTIY
jgi:hypothetical protein